MVHLPPLPGDPLYRRGGAAAVLQHALADADALVLGGVDALIVENFGSTPFAKGSRAEPAPPHQVVMLARVAAAIRERHGLPLGVNCLRNDARAAVAIAALLDLEFVRINIHTGAYITDQGLIEGEAASTMRYRRELDAEGIAILADVLVKHASPLAPISAGDATRDCLERGLAQGVIVTGAATGAAIDAGLLREVRAAAGEEPVYLGSGLTPEGVAHLAPLADGAIVGTWLKVDGKVRAPVDVQRVRTLAAALQGRFRGGGASCTNSG